MEPTSVQHVARAGASPLAGEHAPAATVRVAIASPDTAFIEALRRTVGAGYVFQAIFDPAAPLPQCDVLAVDAGCTARHGADYIGQVLAQRRVPVVYLVPPESPHWALDAIAAGATTYLVKLPSCAVLFDHAAHDATARHAERAQLREALAALHAARHAAQDKQARGQAARRSSPDDRRETLIETITRQLRSGDIVIPPYPNINAKLGKLVEEQADVPDIAALLRNDAAICSRLVAVSNSARYGTRREIKSLEQAVSLIGINETRRYVEVMSNQSLYVTRHARMQPLLKRLWEHSMAVAHASHAISRLTRVGSADELFMMGLLHDVGTLLLLQIIGDLEARGVSAESMPCEELEAFTAAHHGVFGKSVLDRWKFPERYGLVAVRHGAEVSDEHAHELLVVHFANRLAQNLGYSVYPKPPHDLAALASAKLLRLRADEVAQVEEQVKALVEAVKLEIV